MTYIWVMIIIFSCAYIQTIAGFAFSLISVPAFLLCGFSLPDAVALTMVSSACQKTMLVWHCRKSTDWKTLFMIIPWAVLGLIIGVLVLKIMSSASPDIIKQVFGVIIIFVIILKFIVRVKPREKLPVASGFIVSFISGILHGFANIGGPPLVFWVLAHKWPKDRLRSFIPSFIILLLPVQIVFMLIAFGVGVLSQALVGIYYIPLILLAFFLGNISSNWLSIHRVRLIITLLLLMTGIAYTIMPFLKSNITQQSSYSEEPVILPKR